MKNLTESEKEMKLGHYARVFAELHQENPKQFTSDFLMDKLVKEYEKLEFEPIN